MMQKQSGQNTCSSAHSDAEKSGYICFCNWHLLVHLNKRLYIHLWSVRVLL